MTQYGFCLLATDGTGTGTGTPFHQLLDTEGHIRKTAFAMPMHAGRAKGTTAEGLAGHSLPLKQWPHRPNPEGLGLAAPSCRIGGAIHLAPSTCCRKAIARQTCGPTQTISSFPTSPSTMLLTRSAIDHAECRALRGPSGRKRGLYVARRRPLKCSKASFEDGLGGLP